MDLRRWQAEVLPLIDDSIESGERGVVQATTGAGKSVVVAHTAQRFLHRHPGERVVVSTPTVQLVEQLGATLRSVLGDDAVGLFYTRKKQHARPVTVVCNPSVAALAAVAPRPGLWIGDEIHKTEASKEYFDHEGGEDADEAAFLALNPVRRVGFTATPFLAGKGRISTFDRVIYTYSPADALRDGVIVPWRVVPWSKEDLEIDDACVEMIYDVLCEEGAHKDGRRCYPGVVDASSIADAEQFVTRLAQNDISAKAIHSRLPAATREALLRDLQGGTYDCLVHVSMLQEGVDLPWLRWLCMRREVGSRVRFIQQVGRPIRAYPGKTEAIILDPHGLFDRFRITDQAALGFDPPAPPPNPEEIRLGEAASIRDAKTPEQKYAAQTAALGRYVRDLYQSLAIEGVPMPPRKIAAGPWRLEGASDGQVRGLVRMQAVARRLPHEHARTVARIVSVPDLVSKGIACDAVDMLKALSTVSSFTPALPIAIPPDEAFTPPIIRTLHVALVLSKTHTAGAILRGREEVWSNVRERRTAPGQDAEGKPYDADDFLALHQRLGDYAVKKMRATDEEIVGSHQGAIVRAIRRHPRITFRVVPEKENPAVARCWKMIGKTRSVK